MVYLPFQARWVVGRRAAGGIVRGGECVEHVGVALLWRAMRQVVGVVGVEGEGVEELLDRGWDVEKAALRHDGGWGEGCRGWLARRGVDGWGSVVLYSLSYAR